MRKVAIATDSVRCLPQELVEEYDIHIVPLQIIHKGKSYRDGINIKPNEVYKIMRQRQNLPTTSTASAGDFLNVYRQLSQETKSILCITVTSLQSQTFQAASVAKEIAKEELPNTTIEVLDSRSVAGALGFIVREAAHLASKGAELAGAVKAARDMMGKVNFLAMLDTLYYLARLGRIARAAAWAGSILSIKPILEHSPAVGETMPVARPRTKARAIKHMMDIMAQRVGDSKVHVMVQHADEPAEAEKLLTEIKSRFDCVEHYITEFTPVIGLHTGPGLLAIAFYTD